MAMTIQFKRGLLANLPTLSVAELAFTTDSKQVFVGTEEGNLQLALTTDVEAALNASKSYTDTEISTLGAKVANDIQTAVAAVTFENATAEADGLMSKEDKAAHDALVAKQAEFEAKETVEGAQAKADAALASANTYTDGKIQELVGGVDVPTELDTVKELATAIKGLKEEDVAGLLSALAGKADAVHTHAAADIVEDETHRFATDAEKAAWNAKAETADVTSAVEASQTALQGNIDAVSARVQALETATVIDGGTF